ncbi:MAG TPA: cation:proton antiporter, partial [Burkholderiales bacterium]|nr:cation:proton antiporter [Burkholderiales bacterium]
MPLSFLPTLPLPASPLVLFGVLLIAGHIGGELVYRITSLPRITGYVLVGMLLGASGLKLLTPELTSIANVFVDIALGLV